MLLSLLLTCLGIAAVSPTISTSEERYNFFNVDLLQAINEELDGNVVVSPASVKLALSILLEGTGGFTRQQLLSVLRLPDEQTKIRELAQRTVAQLTRSENGTEIDSASSLWVQNGFPVNADYANTLQRYYEGSVQQTDFTSAEVATSRINDWVRRATRNKIQSLTDSGVSPSTRMLLTTALYFKGRWLKAFDTKKTNLKCFNVPNKGCQETHFMENTSKYRYARVPTLDADVVEIPYSDRKTVMLVLLPRKENDHNLRILSKDLSYVPISSLLESLRETEIQLSLPKFSIERKPDLRPALTRVGIESIFTATANLSGIAHDGALRVAGITQNAKIEVDEEGTIAAAVTTYVITPLIASSIEIFTANRPFVFMIVDLETGGTLFSGRLLQPNEQRATR